jgi:collagenase-like PrtC family protease
MGKYNFALPLHWGQKYLNDIFSIEKGTAKKTGEIEAFYGCLNDSPFTSGRMPISYQDISRCDAAVIIDIIHKYNKKFFYLLNAPSTYKLMQLQKEFIQFLLRINCDAFVVSDIGTAKVIRDINADINLHISTIADIDTPQKLESWLPLNPKRLVLSHDTPKEVEKLEALLEALHLHNIDPEIMVTESCIFHCPWRAKHYKALSLGENDRQFHDNCYKFRKNDISSLFSAGSFIRPEDVSFYNDLYKINYFKITGRSQTDQWIKNTVSSYLKGSFKGNLVELMGMDPQIEPHKFFTLPEYFLDAYIEKLLINKIDNKTLSNQYADIYSSGLI